MLQPQSQPPPPPPAPPPAPPAGGAGLATLASVAPPPPGAPAEVKVTVEEPKKSLVDPKLALLLPLGGFAVFVVLTLFVVLYALVIRPHTSAAARGAEAAAVTPP